MQRFESVGGEVHGFEADAVLTEQSREIVDLGPDIVVQVLEEEDVATWCGQLDIDAAHAFESTVAEAVADGGLEGDMLHEFLVRAER